MEIKLFNEDVSYLHKMSEKQLEAITSFLVQFIASYSRRLSFAVLRKFSVEVLPKVLPFLRVII